MGIHHHIPGLVKTTKDHYYRKALNYHPSVNPASKPGRLLESGGHRSIDNLWTGLHRNAHGKWATAGVAGLATGTMVLTAAPRAAEQRTNQAVQLQSQEGNVESLISTRGDEIGYNVNLQRLSDLQSQGDLVFALNRLRN